MSNRIIDTPTVDRLSALVAIAKENGLALSIDFMGALNKNLWIIQLFDAKERLVISANGTTAIEAINRIHANWFTKTAPKT